MLDVFLSALLNFTLPPTIPSGIRKNEVKIPSMVKGFGFLVFVFLHLHVHMHESVYVCACINADQMTTCGSMCVCTLKHVCVHLCMCMHPMCRSEDNLWECVCVHVCIQVCASLYGICVCMRPVGQRTTVGVGVCMYICVYKCVHLCMVYVYACAM